MPTQVLETTRQATHFARVDERYTLIRVLLIVCAGLSVYWSGMSGAFLFDDIPNIVESPLVKGPLVSSFQTTRPLTIASFCFNYHLTGMSAFGFHSFNNAVHVAAAIMFYLLLVETLSKQTFGSVNAPWLAFAIALIWCVHPLNTQAVTYIVQRAESMTGLFFFTFLFCLAKSSESKTPTAWLCTAFVAMCLGLGCKQVMLMALPVGLLYDKVFLAGSFKASFKARNWFWLLNGSLVLVGAAFVLPSISGSAGGVGFDLANVNFIEYLTTQPKVILYYARLIVFPNPLILDYGWHPEKRTIVLVATGMICVAIVAISAFAVRKNSHWGFWPLAALLVLAPTSSVIPLIDLLVEHRMYIPGAFLIAMLGVASTAFMSSVFGKHSETIQLAAWAITFIALATITWHRNRTYRSSVIMWEDVVNKAPENWRGYFNLGCELESDSTERSVSMYEKAIELNPYFPSSLSNLGFLQLKQGKVAESITNIRRAIELDDRFVDAHINLGLAMKSSGDEEAALSLFRRALEIDPRSSKGHYNFGTLIAKTNGALAAQHLSVAIKLNPDFSQSHNNLAALIEEQDPQSALFHYREAIRIDPANAQAHRNLETLIGKLTH